jgi:hypothetical protein
VDKTTRVRPEGTDVMHIDCDTCAVRGPACGGCVVTALLGSTPDGVEWDETERAALGVLADSGLVPPLRMVPTFIGQEQVFRTRPRGGRAVG